MSVILTILLRRLADAVIIFFLLILNAFVGYLVDALAARGRLVLAIAAGARDALHLIFANDFVTTSIATSRVGYSLKPDR